MSATAVTARPSQGRAFRAVLRRDLYVTGKEFFVFLAQVILQPLFLLFVFGKVLGSLGYTQNNYAHLLFPGLLALTAVITGMQSLAFPLVLEFGWTKEIEDRLLAPIPIPLVAVEKVVIAMLRGLVAATLLFPIGALVLGSAPWRAEGLPLLILVLVLGGLSGGTVGLIIGTLLPPSRLNIMFALILTPLLFTGATQYPWPSLDRLPWFQVVTALNPLTYVSEGVRAALVPDVPHMPPWVCVLVLIVSGVAFMAVGMLGFQRRALD
jgi:ABC-2 type transport system permease protein